MHTLEDEVFLSSLSVDDKMSRTTIDEFKNRGTLIRKYEYWYLTVNEQPHKDRGNTQLVLWLTNKMHANILKDYKPTGEPSLLAMNEFNRICKRYKGFGFARNRETDCSVKRYHIHLFN